MSQVKKCSLKEAIKMWEEKAGEKAIEAERIDLMGWIPPIEKMDSSTSHIPNCQRLSLSTNMIERISNLNPLKFLKILSIGRNYLKSLAGVEAAGDTLEQIWASYNMIEKPSKGVTSCRKLRVLYLANNLVREWPEIGRLNECLELEEMVLAAEGTIGNPIEEKYASTGSQSEWQREVAKRVPQLRKLDGVTIVLDTQEDNDNPPSDAS